MSEDFGIALANGNTIQESPVLALILDVEDLDSVGAFVHLARDDAMVTRNQRSGDGEGVVFPSANRDGVQAKFNVVGQLLVLRLEFAPHVTCVIRIRGRIFGLRTGCSASPAIGRGFGLCGVSHIVCNR